MAFERPTLTEIYTRVTSDLKTKIVGALTFLKRSVLIVIAKILSGAIHLVYGYLDNIVSQLFAMTADTVYLEQIGLEIGISRKAGDHAVGQAVVTGTTGNVVDAGTRLQSASGNIYTVDSNVTLLSGTGVIDLTSENVGLAYNESGGISLSFVSPVSGIDSVAVVSSSGLTGGLDSETDDDYRARVLLRKRRPPQGGCDFDYVAWCLEVPGVTRAWAIPEYFGIGTVGVAFVRDDDTPIIPNSTEIAQVEAYIISHTDPVTNISIGIPVTAEAGLRMITLTALAIDMTVQVYPNTNAVQTAILTRLADCIKSFGGPGETIALSQLYEAIGAASGEIMHRIINPIADVTAATDQIHTLGTITFQEYA